MRVVPLPRRHRPLVALIAPLAAIVALAGCTSSALVRKQPAAELRAVHGVRAISVTESDQRMLYDAEQILIAHCMRSAGFNYWPEGYVAPAPLATEFPFLPASMASARRYGFAAGVDPPSSETDRNLSYFRSLPPSKSAAYGLDLNGGPGMPAVEAKIPQGFVIGQSAGGCVAVAEGVLYGSFAKWFAASVTAENLPPLWQTQTEADPRFSAAVTRWSRCMRSAGYSYPSPAAAAERFGSSNPGKIEIRTAVATLKCAAAVRLTVTETQIAAYYEKILDRKYAKEVNAFWRLESDAVPLASAITKSVHA
jgi:hypothetical protein